MIICKRVYYSGMVQGVGFRMKALHISRRYSVTGYVKNLPDQRVELVAVGESEQVEKFLGAVASRMADCITGQDLHDETVQEFATFEIRV